MWAMALRPPTGMNGRDVILRLAEGGGIAEQVDEDSWLWVPADRRISVVSYDESPRRHPELTVILDVYATDGRACYAAARDLASRLNAWPGCDAHANLPEFSQHPDDALTA